MTSQDKLFKQQKVRTHWDEKEEKWYFSVVDVISILTNQPTFQGARNYWKVLKSRLLKEGNETVTNCNRLKLVAEDGKMRMTDVADTEQLLRLIQSIPSPKAEPFKLWLAKVGYERMQEIADPEQGLDRARENWRKLGRSEKWIQQRMTGQDTRNKLTDYWKESGVEKSDEFAFLTNIIHTEWAGLSVKKHKDLKGLKTQNLRDHMTEAELIFTALAELSTRQIAETDRAKGLKQNATAGMKGGRIAKDARLALENKTGRKVITGENFLPPVYEKKKINKK
ncbi:Bro-N domain-containing protein [Daejeonella sp.]|uniref:BRO-N domain-containing protein n=1 Tax=Daejeonella sp. TaxID=2805397 RepID=UPI0027314637|nr:Bro-N domain-containing protein [Daejeonella sp.]MDP2412663.1 Bro-N domain-containing protein [Daejeonella sp.]